MIVDNSGDSKEAKEGAADAKPFVILVTTNFPFFFVGDRAVTIDNLQKELSEAAQKDPQLKVAIRADKQAPFGEIVKLIDASKLAQVGGLNFVTERAAPTK